MTETEIMALAEKFAAHRDVREIELRGGAILEFVRAYNEECVRQWAVTLKQYRNPYANDKNYRGGTAVCAYKQADCPKRDDAPGVCNCCQMPISWHAEG